MAKRNDYITGREDGLLMALEIVKNEGVEALEKEIKFRNVTGIRTALAKKKTLTGRQSRSKNRQ